MIKIHSYRLIIPILLLIVLISCTSKKGYEYSESFELGDFKQTISLKGNTVSLNEPIMKPVRIYLEDSMLILINVQTEFFIDKYNLKTLKKTGECISFGNGPEEMIAPIKIEIDDSLLWILDGGKQRLMGYNKADFFKNQTPLTCQSISFNNYFRDILFLKEGKIVVISPNSDNKRLTFFNKKGEKLNSAGEYPVFPEIQISPIEMSTAYACNIVTNHAKDKIFVTYLQTDLIEIYDINGNLLKRKQGPDNFFPNIAKRSNGENITIGSIGGKSRDAYFCPVTYNNEIYALYSGELFNPDNNKLNHNKIFVFDWEGNPVRRYDLDTSIYAFTIDQRTGTIYGLSDEPEYHLVKFNM